MHRQRLIIITVVVTLLAFFSGKLLDAIYKKRWDALWFQKTNELVSSSADFDIIFLGNSRVHFGINPYYVDSVTTLNSYNFGTGGADAEEMLLITNTYLANHPAPRFAVISLDAGNLFESSILKTKYHYLFYLGDSSVSDIMHNAGFPTRLIRIFPFLKYSFFDEYNRTSLFVKGKPYPMFDHNQYKGFLNVHQFLENNETRIYNSIGAPARISTEAVEKFEQMIKEFQAHGTTVLFAWPPVRSNARKVHSGIERRADSIFHQFEKRNGLTAFHFENDPQYVDQYFVDDIHFNEPGSRIYSRALGDSIVQYLNRKRNRALPVDN